MEAPSLSLRGSRYRNVPRWHKDNVKKHNGLTHHICRYEILGWKRIKFRHDCTSRLGNVFVGGGLKIRRLLHIYVWISDFFIESLLEKFSPFSINRVFPPASDNLEIYTTFKFAWLSETSQLRQNFFRSDCFIIRTYSLQQVGSSVSGFCKISELFDF